MITQKVSEYYWYPQPGPQAEAYTCPVDEIFIGGTRGGGKSDLLIGRQVKGALRHGIQWNGLMVRRKYKDFKELRRRWDELIMAGLPAERVGGENQINYIRFANGANVSLAAINAIIQADDFQGHQYVEISLDEAPSIPFIGQLMDRLKGCLRSPHGIKCQMVLSGNPGGPGASQIKVMFIPECDGGEAPVGEGQVNRIFHTLFDGTEVVFTRVFIKSVLSDNLVLKDMDPLYEARLRSINDPALVAAWLDGRWDVFVGQAFNFTERHIVEPVWPIPEHAPIVMTYDWGYGAPFSIGWWWVDNDDRIYRFAEWYGWDKVTTNVGLRLTDAEVAEGVMQREKEMGIWDRDIRRLADPTCQNKKPDYKGGGQGDSTMDEFKAVHPKLELFAGDANRVLKIRQFRNRLRIPDDPKEKPMLVVYNTCKQFIRIIPDLCIDELTGEYLEKGQELHPFDDACHVCMDRPQGADEDALKKFHDEQVKKEKMAALDSASMVAALEIDKIISDLQDEEEENTNMEEVFFDD
ncbi:hypothetical protein LCGC14_0614610 [marine sediment metagenome]|uniref:Phage terminase large subunit N-terminal domain-containing protein n=1 Tax=marine sediment metagenome TaxID=412755 RepID=A0A0F9TSZ1_9ZZZZ